MKRGWARSVLVLDEPVRWGSHLRCLKILSDLGEASDMA